MNKQTDKQTDKETIDTLREIEALAREIKRSKAADAIVCKCIDALARLTR